MAVQEPASGLVSNNGSILYNEQGIPIEFPFTPCNFKLTIIAFYMSLTHITTLVRSCSKANDFKSTAK